MQLPQHGVKNNTPIITKADEESHEIAVNIKINCPMSTELKDFVKSIPPEDKHSSSFEEWKLSFIKNMTRLMRLVESEKVFNAFWSVKTDDRLSKEIEESSIGQNLATILNWLNLRNPGSV